MRLEEGCWEKQSQMQEQMDFGFYFSGQSHGDHTEGNRHGSTLEGRNRIAVNEVHVDTEARDIEGL